METLPAVILLLREVLQLPHSVKLEQETFLLGEIPELDSMAVVNVLTAVEEQFDFEIDDDEMSASIFETVGTLVEFVNEKRASDQSAA